MALRVAIWTVHHFVLLFDVQNSRLDPSHVLIGFVLRKLAGILADWTLAVGRLWEEKESLEQFSHHQGLAIGVSQLDQSGALPR